MKCQETSSDRKATVVLKTDGSDCDEYGAYQASDGAFCTYVPVKVGQKLSIEAKIKGLIQEIHIDLIVDGVLRNSSRNAFKSLKKESRCDKIITGFYAQSKTTILEADMIVKGLDISAYPAILKENQDSVGMFEVRVSLLRDVNEERHQLNDVKSFETVMDWKDEYRSPTFTRIRPTLEVDFVPTENQRSKGWITKLKHRATFNRPGTKPWAVFRFFYRTQDAINHEAMTRGPTTNFESQALKIVSTSALTEGDTAASEMADTENGDLPSRATTEDVTQSAPSADIGSGEPESVQHDLSSQHPHPMVLIVQTPTDPSKPSPTPYLEKTSINAHESANMSRSHSATPEPQGQPAPATKTSGIEFTTKIASLPPVNTLREIPKEIKTTTPIPAIIQNELSTNTTELSTDKTIQEEKKPDIFNGANDMNNTPEINRIHNIKATNGVKRNMSSTPDSAAKRMKVENEVTERLLAEKRSQLAEKRQKRMEAEKKAKQAETQRSAELQAIMAEIDGQIAEEERLEAEAEFDFEDSEAAIDSYYRHHTPEI